MEIASFLKEITDNNEKVTPKVYSKNVLSNNTKQKLLLYQEKHVVRLINILLQYNIAVDGSETGIGKTYIAAAICKELNRRPIIICPKTLIYNWINVLEYFGIKAYEIVNYETIRNGKTYTNNKYKTRKSSPFINIVDPDPENLLKSIYEWDLPKDAIIIFDESHRCKDPSTQNGKLLLSSKQAILEKNPVLLLSATICENFSDMKIPFCLFSFIPNTRNYNHFIKTLKQKYPKFRIKRSDYATTNDYTKARENAQAMMIYEEIKDYTSRIRIKELGDMFPSNQICCQQFMADETDKISEAYEEMAVLLKQLKENPGGNHLSKIQKLKQEIELRKAPIFIEQAQLYLDEGKSVIIFVNFLDTFKVIAEALDIKCKVYGSIDGKQQTMEERQEAINQFQSNQERIIILQIRAGGVGISLHDIHGGHPRVTLLNFSDSGSDLIQALGRAPRSGAKSPVLQRIIFVANIDYEKVIMRNINRKLANICCINDGDMNGYKYGVKKITRRIVKNNNDDTNKKVNIEEDKEVLDNL